MLYDPVWFKNETERGKGEQFQRFFFKFKTYKNVHDSKFFIFMPRQFKMYMYEI